MKRYNYIRLLTLALLAISIFSIGANAQSKKDRAVAKKLTDLADRAFTTKNYREAADKYAQSFALVPTNPFGHYRKGFAHFELKESEQALTEFALALSQGYKPLEIFKVRAYLYYDQKNYDAALEETNKAVALDPKNLLLLKAVGEINFSKKA